VFRTVLALALLIAGAVALDVVPFIAPSAPVVLAVFLAWAALCAWVAWRPAAALVGPLFFYELLRLARRGRSTLLRCLYALALLGVLYFVYAHHFPHAPLLTNPFTEGLGLPLADLARLAGGFVAAVVALQGLVVVLCAPAYLAGAIAEERERRTLELLFTTHLTDREIVLGKLCGRLAHLAGVLLAGLPVLSVLQLWGGVDAAALLAGFVVTVMTLFSVGGICLLCSALARDSLTAVLTSYTVVLCGAAASVVLPGCFIASPLSFMLVVEELLGADALHQIIPWPSMSGHASFGDGAILFMAFVYALIHGTIGVCCLWSAEAHLRGLPPQLPRKPRGRTLSGWGPEETPVALLVEPPARPCHPVTDPPLLWKEVYHGAGPAAAWSFRAVYLPAVATLFGLLLAVVLVGVVLIAPSQSLSFWQAEHLIVHDAANPVLRIVVILLAGAWGLGVAWRAVGSVSRERARGTLVGLLMLPGDRSAVLNAKWLGGPLRYRWLGYGLLAALTVGLVSGAFHPLAVLLLAAAVVAYVAFLASLGVWLSLVSRNTLTAYLCMALVLLLMFCGSLVAAAYTDLFLGAYGAPEWWVNVTEVGMNPPRGLWSLGFTWDEFATDVWRADGELRPVLRAVLYGVLGYGLMAGLLWLAARHRFRREELGGAKQ
jgi:ABC-type transport system involved in multi-copper enzyme maturation permease subunit